MKREREKKITRLHLILFALVVTTIIIVVTTVMTSGNKKIERYKKLEKDLNTATIYYYGSKMAQVMNEVQEDKIKEDEMAFEQGRKVQEEELEKGRMKVIKMQTIIDNGYLQDEITSKCKGYTIVSNYRIAGEYEISYESYIKCGNAYVTPDFEEEYLK